MALERLLLGHGHPAESPVLSTMSGETRNERQEQGCSLYGPDPTGIQPRLWVSSHIQSTDCSSGPPTTLSKQLGFGDGKAAVGILIYSRNYHTKASGAPREGTSWEGLRVHLLGPLVVG